MNNRESSSGHGQEKDPNGFALRRTWLGTIGNADTIGLAKIGFKWKKIEEK